MNSIRFTKWLFSTLLFISVAVSSCQKDDNVKSMDSNKSIAAADSASTMGVINTPGNFLAGKGTLKITIEDSTYTFDAATDSVAFINVHSGDSKYFGITAINKAHTMSFGISSVGFAATNVNSKVAGSQFLFKLDEKNPVVQYTLTKYGGKDDSGKISIEKYNNDNLIAKGTFFTFLAKDDKVNSPFYRVEGSFELQLK
ncbi:hypothetical protein SAMN05421821_103187 [Mucilaginibacter lappiensis]|uniref:DUF4402 domain-containing protein n=1 Tax=Mucilaginibacter lappiensis TaxID=354630 RepID=A0ABR6PGS0_9SPHI|nr:hypothetical protein [Mucilaginibacter lappiensis]MBB6108953.1 hypothetical protein [Mucilaginibacter lappiensis]SIQ69174.1 hypothetical protein SAMN05421821_103187 [Mucilaginibacter lappiensis]